MKPSDKHAAGAPAGDGYLLYGLVGLEVLLEGLGALAVGQHDVVGDGRAGAALGLDVGPVLHGQVEAHHQVALGDVHALLHDAGGDQQVGLVGPELTKNLRERPRSGSNGDAVNWVFTDIYIQYIHIH